MKTFLSILILNLLLVFSQQNIFATGIDIAKVLNQPVTITNHNNKTFSGNISRTSSGVIRIHTVADQGEVIFTFKSIDISKTEFPGNEYFILASDLYENGDFKECINILENLYKQRYIYFDLFKENELSEFLTLLSAQVETKNYTGAIALADNLLTHLKSDSMIDEINSQVLLCYYQLNLYEDASIQAKKLLHKKNVIENAISWWVLAQINFENKKPDAALWLCLQPIVFSSYMPIKYLEHCYSLAIAIYLEKDEPEKAKRLFFEMNERNLPWPDIPQLTDYRNKFDAIINQQSSVSKSISNESNSQNNTISTEQRNKNMNDAEILNIRKIK